VKKNQKITGIRQIHAKNGARKMQSHTDDVLSDEMVMDKALLDET